MSDKSKWAKDFGFYMHNQTKHTPGQPVFLLPRMTFWALAMIDQDLFSITSNTDVEGEPYAMTIDFDRQIFEQILTLIPDRQASALRRITEADQTPVVMRFDQEPITLQFRVRLGELEHGDGEDFIPFIAIDVSPAG